MLLGGEKKNVKHAVLLSQFLKHPLYAPPLRSPWCPSLDLLQCVDVCLMLGSPSQGILQRSSCSLASTIVGWASFPVGKVACTAEIATAYLSS